MTASVYTSIFDSVEYAPLAVEEETALIVAAQAGDDEAKMRLFTAYTPVLRKHAKKFAARFDMKAEPVRYFTALGDAEGDVAAAFFEAIIEHDAERSPRLAGSITFRLRKALAEAVAADGNFAVPERTLSRFYSILRIARDTADESRNVYALAREIAGEHGMSAAVWDATYAAVKAASLDEEDGDGRALADSMLTFPLPGTESSFDETEDRVLIDLAFSAVDTEEESVVRLAYGFTGTEDYAEGEPVPDLAIAEHLGMTRPTVQRRRSAALGKMRKALGVTDTPA